MSMTTITQTSSSCDSVLPPKKRMRPLNDAPDNSLGTVMTAKKTKVAFSGNPKYKGVVQQQNGHWGAQIYVKHKRIWIGTFKSAAEAAVAYDRASIKFGKLDPNSYGNFPHELDFQEEHSEEAVLNMIRDGSYQHKFIDFLINRSQDARSKHDDEKSNKCLWPMQLFEKELTQSDVGKLNRLVIPKKYAVKYLPFVSDDQSEREEGEIGEGVEDVEVVCFDRAKREWKFRYCYWRSSQSFVFTTGWNSFVKEKKIKEKDVIVFYTCNDPSNLKTLGQINKNFMIDVKKFSDKSFHDGTDKVMKTGNVFYSELEDEKPKSEGNKEGFMLFGVWIQ